MSVYAFLSSPKVVCAYCGCFVGVWTYVATQSGVEQGATAWLRGVGRTLEDWVAGVFALSFAAGCSLVANSALFAVAGPANKREAVSVVKAVVVDNSFLQLLAVSLGTHHMNAAEFVLWSTVLTLYSVFRAVLSFLAVRVGSVARRGVSELLVALFIAVLSVLLVSAWLFAPAGLSILLQLHYDAFKLLPQIVSLFLTLRWNSVHANTLELRVASVSNIVTMVQCTHFLLAYMRKLDFPVQVLIFLRLTQAVQSVKRDAVRLSGLKQSVKRLLQQCPPLSDEEVRALGDEKCCICWEPLTYSQCSRLPCRHVHHIECLRRLLSISSQRKCPLCNQPFLPASPHRQQEFMRVLAQLANAHRGIEYAVERVREVLPQASEGDIRRELETTRSISQTITNLIDRSE